jgi:arginine repressor
MKKIDILNYITDFRKSPNDIKTYGQLISHLGAQHEPAVQAMLNELKQLGVIKETEHHGERAYQVAKK